MNLRTALTFIDGSMEEKLIVTLTTDDDDREGEYRAICLWKMKGQNFSTSSIMLYNGKGVPVDEATYPE